jgi:Protein of unknown function (DUF2752)
VISTVDRFMIDRIHSVVAGRERWLGIGACAIAALTYLAVIDPHRPQALLPRCPTKLLTGLDCPACGGLRLTHDLLHGDLPAAVHDNLFLLLSSPVLAVFIWRGWRERVQPGFIAVPRRAAFILAGSALAWTVVRNLPGWPLKPRVA